jgi:large repetitive protein
VGKFWIRWQQAVPSAMALVIAYSGIASAPHPAGQRQTAILSAVTASTFAAAPASGPVGTVVAVHSVGPCVMPAATSGWNAIVGVAQGANSQLTFVNLAVAADGSWSGHITIPGSAGPGAAQLTATCFDSSGVVQATVPYTPLDFTVTVGPLDHLVLAPSAATITVGAAQAYTAEGFDRQGNDLGDVTAAVSFNVDNGTCTGVTCTAAPGAHIVTGTDGAAKGAAGLTVTKAATATTLSVTPGRPSFGTPVTFNANVGPAPPNPLRPSGTISFLLDGKSDPVATVTSAGGLASFTTSGLGAGTHTMVATYSGDANFFSSSSSSASVTVITTTTVSGSHQGGFVVPSGSSFLVINATVAGPISVLPGGALDVENSTIGGTFALGASTLRICGSIVRGSLAVIGARGFVLIGDITDDSCGRNSIAASLVLLNNTHGVEVIGNYVGGALTSAGNSGAGALPEDIGPEISGNGRATNFVFQVQMAALAGGIVELTDSAKAATAASTLKPGQISPVGGPTVHLFRLY